MYRRTKSYATGGKKRKGMKKGGGVMKTKGYATGGVMKTKGYKRGGKV